MDEKRSVLDILLSRFFLLSALSFLILLLIIILLVFPDKQLDSPQICGDGTFENTCSIAKPFFCEAGVLIEKSSICGCYENYTKDNDLCINSLYLDSKENSFRYFFNGEYKQISLNLYGDLYSYFDTLPRSIYYAGEEIPNRRDFVFLKIEDEIQRREIKKLIVKIQNLAPENKLDQARIAISLVQNIPYSNSRDEIDFAGSSTSLSKFPYQVLYDNNGSCEEKSELLILILREMGYGVSAFYYSPENHESVGIKCPIKESLDGSGYCFVETTAPSVIGDNGGDYPGTGKLLSQPEILLIAEGLSFPENLPEYKDSKKIINLREGKMVFIFSKDSFFKKINEKYGILF